MFFSQNHIQALINRGLPSVACLVLLAACNSAPTVAATATNGSASGNPTVTLQHNGQARTALVVQPSKRAEGPVPLILALHPNPGSGAFMRAISKLDEEAGLYGFITVYPDGVGGAWNALGCCGTQDDTGFLRALVAELARQHPINLRRIYVTGMSNGGDLAFKLAMEYPDLVAGIAPVSAGLTGSVVQNKTLKKSPSAISIMAFHGSQDSSFANFEKGLDYWETTNACRPPIFAGATQGLQSLMAVCPDGSAVTRHQIGTMGHAWPRAAAGPTSAGVAYRSPIDATERIVGFFVDVRKPAPSLLQLPPSPALPAR